MLPDEKLQRSSRKARISSHRRKAKQYKINTDKNATIIGYNADTGQNIIQLTDGSIALASSDTNGSVAIGDSVPLHGGTGNIDGLPYIKKQPIIATEALPKTNYPVKVLFSVVNEETGNYEVYIGGDRNIPDLIYSTNNPIQIGRITNTGTNKNDWIVSIKTLSNDPINNPFANQSVIITSTNSYIFDDSSIFLRDLSQFCGAGFIANKLEINTSKYNEEFNSDRIRKGVYTTNPLSHWYYRRRITGVGTEGGSQITSEIIEDPQEVNRQFASVTFPNEYSSLETGSFTLTTPYPFSGTGSGSFSDSTESEYHITQNRFIFDNTTFVNSSNQTKTQNIFSFGIYKDLATGNWVENQNSGIYTDNYSGNTFGFVTYIHDSFGNIIDNIYNGYGESNRTVISTYKQFVFPNLLKDAYFQLVDSSTNTIVRRLYTDVLLSTDMSQTLALKAQIDYDFEFIGDGAESIIADRSIYACVTIDSTGAETLIPVIPEFKREFPQNTYANSNNLEMANYIKEKNKITYINPLSDLFFERFYQCVNKNITYDSMEFTINDTGMTFKNKKVSIKSLKKPDINVSILHASVF